MVCVCVCGFYSQCEKKNNFHSKLIDGNFRLYLEYAHVYTAYTIESVSIYTSANEIFVGVRI